MQLLCQCFTPQIKVKTFLHVSHLNFNFTVWVLTQYFDSQLSQSKGIELETLICDWLFEFNYYYLFSTLKSLHLVHQDYVRMWEKRCWLFKRRKWLSDNQSESDGLIFILLNMISSQRDNSVICSLLISPQNLFISDSLHKPWCTTYDMKHLSDASNEEDLNTLKIVLFNHVVYSNIFNLDSLFLIDNLRSQVKIISV